jgi:hypothetical protein
MSLKNSNVTIGNRVPDLPVCSVVTQPLRHRAPHNLCTKHNNFLIGQHSSYGPSVKLVTCNLVVTLRTGEYLSPGPIWTFLCFTDDLVCACRPPTTPYRQTYSSYRLAGSNCASTRHKTATAATC